MKVCVCRAFHEGRCGIVNVINATNPVMHAYGDDHLGRGRACGTSVEGRTCGAKRGVGSGSSRVDRERLGEGEGVRGVAS